MSPLSKVIMLSDERERIEDVLDTLIEKSGSLCAILITKDGHTISARGTTSFLNITALATLVAGSFAATRQVAALIGEKEFSILFQQGASRHVHISLVAGTAMLIAVFEDSQRIGLVRLHAKRAADGLAALMSVSRERTDREELIVAQFKEFASSLIDRIFSE
ncbi:roadblock/LC7 domain-containing protein [Candidatus Fermentibacteria bacterium]|nr:roadblock/LC7 domain-containing protein [Candidatus Fermentibacteria bacterium]